MPMLEDASRQDPMAGSYRLQQIGACDWTMRQHGLKSHSKFLALRSARITFSARANALSRKVEVKQSGPALRTADVVGHRLEALFDIPLARPVDHHMLRGTTRFKPFDSHFRRLYVPLDQPHGVQLDQTL